MFPSKACTTLLLFSTHENLLHDMEAARQVFRDIWSVAAREDLGDEYLKVVEGTGECRA